MLTGPGRSPPWPPCPASSSHHQAAQIAAVRLHVAPAPGQPLVSADDVQAAGSRRSRLTLDEARQLYLTGQVLKAALDCAAAGQSLGSGTLLGCPLDERALRFGLERCYRDQARLAPDRRHRVELIDLANLVRPRTWS